LLVIWLQICWIYCGKWAAAYGLIKGKHREKMKQLD
jgi:hypothetical protein